MPDDVKKTEVDETEAARAAKRRKFLKTAAKVAVTTPAVTLMLSAGARKTAHAGPYDHF